MKSEDKKVHIYLNGTIDQLNAMVQDIADEVNRIDSSPDGVFTKSHFETEEQYQSRIKRYSK